jgi:hypothetical protein
MPGIQPQPAASVGPRLLTIAELAQILGISYQAAHHFVRRRLEPSPDSPVVYLAPHVKRSRLDRWIAWLEARTGQPPEPEAPTRKRLEDCSERMTKLNRGRRDARTPKEIIAEAVPAKGSGALP